MKIKLPWPDAILFSNERPHWTDKRKATKRYKSDCYYLTKHQAKGFKAPTGNQPLSIMFHQPRNAFDLDNCLGALKAALDGVAEALNVNDRIFRPITIDFGDVVDGGEVVIEFLG